MANNAIPTASPEENPACEYPIHPLLTQRRSLRAFSSRAVEPEVLGSLLEAARWAPSCMNQQPWSFIVTTQRNKPDFERLLGCLMEFNVEWARHAPMLILSIAGLTFESNGKVNRHALHDVGQAMAGLTFQASVSGLVVHQMAGFDMEKARHEFSIPLVHEPVAVAAIGYPGSPDSLSDKLRQRELSPRKRKSLNDFVFEGRWGRAADWIGRELKRGANFAFPSSSP
jgi:nitroreductase